MYNTQTAGALGVLKNKMASLKNENDNLRDDNDNLKREVEKWKDEVSRVGVAFLFGSRFRGPWPFTVRA